MIRATLLVNLVRRFLDRILMGNKYIHCSMDCAFRSTLWFVFFFIRPFLFGNAVPLNDYDDNNKSLSQVQFRKCAIDENTASMLLFIKYGICVWAWHGWQRHTHTQKKHSRSGAMLFSALVVDCVNLLVWNRLLRFHWMATCTLLFCVHGVYLCNNFDACEVMHTNLGRVSIEKP